jgi:hypothetical protein
MRGTSHLFGRGPVTRPSTSAASRVISPIGALLAVGGVCELALQRSRQAEPAVEPDRSPVLIGDGARERVRAASGGLRSGAQFECEAVTVSRFHAVIVLTRQTLRMRGRPHLFGADELAELLLGRWLLALERFRERPPTAHAKLVVDVAEVVLDRLGRHE